MSWHIICTLLKTTLWNVLTPIGVFLFFNILESNCKSPAREKCILPLLKYVRNHTAVIGLQLNSFNVHMESLKSDTHTALRKSDYALRLYGFLALANGSFRIKVILRSKWLWQDCGKRPTEQADHILFTFSHAGGMATPPPVPGTVQSGQLLHTGNWYFLYFL